MELPYLWGGIVALIVIMMAIAVRLDKQRAAALRRVAAELGFDYQPAGQPLEAATTAVMPLFHRGSYTAKHHILRGTTAGTEVTLFDYTYKVGRSSHTQTVAAYRVGPDVPVFQLGPENLLHRVGATLGFEDIDFASAPEFSERYLLRGPDEAAIRAFFTPALLAFFASLDRRSPWHVEAGRGWIAIYADARRWDPAEMQALLAVTNRIYSAVRPSASPRAPGPRA